MKETLKYKIGRKVLFTTGLLMLSEIIFPTASFALTSGPASPEFSSFEPVATTNMVNEFTGDFMYNLPVLNIPGANGGGYALSLSYHSGTSPEEEASWVGYGWTLNPGSINRGKRGFPDDSKGSTVNYWSKTKPNRTVSLGGSLSVEAFSADLKNLLGGSVNASLRYNNYKGFGISKGVNLSIAKGLVSLGYSTSDGEGSFSARVNPMAILSLLKDKQQEDDKNSQKHTLKEGITKVRNSGIGALSLVGSNYGIFTHSGAVRASNMTKYKGGSVNLSFGFIPTGIPLQLGPNVELSGNYSWQQNVNSNDQSDAADPIGTYGYMYLASATAGSSQMDYYTEKDNPYDKRDYYLGVPFSNADNYAISGEGIGGGFRMYNKTAGHYSPRNVTSKIDIINVGGEVEAGLDVGAGADLGAGFQRFRSKGWNLSGGFSDSAVAGNIVDEPYLLRFNNDAGGYFDFNNDGLQRASINTDKATPGFKAFSADIAGINTTSNANNRSGRSSYIAYHTNKEMTYIKNSKKYKTYTLSKDINDLVDRPSVNDGVGEMVVFNEDGTRYNYGLPVYSRKESNLQYDVIGVSAGNIKNNYIAYRDVSDINKLKTKLGEESPAPYASTYLLTEITSTDYSDRTFDGPTDDDFGGYTRFSYKREHGAFNKNASAEWYRWRIPYTGLLYNKGELSTQDDDMGSLVYGEKEIYYLDTVVTKTHFAVFETSDRTDGLEAASFNTAAKDSTAKGSKKMKKLDRIKLYSKNNGVAGGPKLIQTVNFEYYSSTDANTLSKGLPNSSVAGGGKLTLKRVWIEYEGVTGARISPYLFEYKYPSQPATDYPTEYDQLESIWNYTASQQNPNYSPFSLDAWGNYQANGKARYDLMKNWVTQAPGSDFDPAAWQLKVIKLPTGGEIHVQYEQDEYNYVQDKPVEAMISLSGNSNDDTSEAKYYLNVGDFGLSDDETDKLKVLIQQYYITPKKKMYFKFLYTLIGNPISDLKSCKAEYITGYCNVKEVDIDNDGIYVKLGQTGAGGKFDLPKKVCRDYVKKERLGNLNLSGVCDPSTVGIDMESTPKQVIEQLVGFAATQIIPGDLELCRAVNFSLSYLKVPMPKAKKGGGIRVKRILMYDKGIENGDKSLFGNEYDYTMENGSSSGVATSEPASIREESVLVEFDPRLKQKFFDKVVSGRDRDQTEKPLGESVLPSPSVGYSRIAIKNIHSGKTNTGFTVKEFFTAKDFPMQVDYTDIKQQKDYIVIPAGFVNYNVNNIWMTQGYQIKLNEMHGQMRREATYGGDPGNTSKTLLSSEQVYEYYQPGELIPVMNSLNSISYQPLGKETELVFETRGMEDITNDIQVEFDASVGFLVPLPIPQFSIIPTYSYSESQMYAHVTNKIIQYPAMQKRVITYADGIYHLTENLAFNPHTGKPIATRTTDGYDKLNLQLSSKHNGSYTNYNVPASQQYSSMGQRAKNERFIFSATKRVADTSPPLHWLELSGTNCNYTAITNKLCPGDLIKVDYASPYGYDIFHVSDSIVSNKIYLNATYNFGVPDFIDQVPSVVEVLRSGCTNQLSTNVGSFTTYGKDDINSQLANLSARQVFTNRLDALLQTGGGTLTSSSVPDSLRITLGASCSILKALSPSINLTVNNGSGTVLLTTAVTVSGETQTCTQALTFTAGQQKHFAVDEKTGELIFYVGSQACATVINCINFCPDLFPNNKANVVAANSQTFADRWPFDTIVYNQVGPNGMNDYKYENGVRGKWRQQANFVYRDTIVGANASNQRNYKNAGVFEMKLFNWKNTALNDTSRWIKINAITQYAPDGNAMEERDIMSIYSAAKFGYDKTQPYLVAKNAEYQSVQFESFEKSYKGQTQFEDGWAVPNISTKLVNGIAHAGNSSWKFSNSDSIQLKSIKITQQMLTNGLSLKVWVRDTSVVDGTSVKGKLKKTGTSVNYTMTKIARTGEWILYEMKATNLSAFSVNNIVTPVIINNYSTKPVWIDDVRLQPLDAQVISYVYDINTLRLIASFDDQHFGLFYQYNGEGKLVRKIIETEKGVKTITETQYHTVQKPKN